MVADPLELVRHVVEGQEVAQVTCDGLLRGDRHADESGHLALGVVDPSVGLDDVEGQVRVVGRQRLAGEADRLLDQRSHAQDRVLDLLLLDVEGVALGLGAARDGTVRACGNDQLIDFVVDGGLILALRSLGHLVPHD